MTALLCVQAERVRESPLATLFQGGALTLAEKNMPFPQRRVMYVALFGVTASLAFAGPIYRALLVAQILFYVAAVAAWAAPGLRKAVPLIVVPYEICFLNWAAVIGVIRYVTKRQRVTWDRPHAAAAS